MLIQKRYCVLSWVLLSCIYGLEALLMWSYLYTCRMPIIDKFKDMGTVVMGKVESGSVREGDSMLIMPNKVPFWTVSFSAKDELPAFLTLILDFTYILQAHVKVLAVYCDDDKVKRAGPGENLRVRLSGVEEEDILAGFVLSSICRFSLLAVHNFLCSLELFQFQVSFYY